MLAAAFVTLTLCAFSANAEEANAQNVTVTVGRHHTGGDTITRTGVYNSGHFSNGPSQTVNITARGKIYVPFTIHARNWLGFPYVKTGGGWCWVDSSTRTLYL